VNKILQFFDHNSEAEMHCMTTQLMEGIIMLEPTAISEEAKAKLLGYLWQQFPVTVGHMPLGSFLDEVIDNAIQKLREENDELQKWKKDYTKQYAEDIVKFREAQFEVELQKAEIDSLQKQVLALR
jgi:hypothetical protein